MTSAAKNEVSEITLPLKSPFAQASNEEWTSFVRTMMTAPTTAVSPSNHLGAFEMTPRRLGDLGLVDNLKRIKSKKSSRINWTGKFIAPLTSDLFLKNLSLQYRAFTVSMENYYSKFTESGVRLPPEVSLSGALAVCHRAGIAGLKGPRFPRTQESFERANGIF